MSPNTLERIDALAAQLALSRSATVDASLRYMLDHFRVAPELTDKTVYRHLSAALPQADVVSSRPTQNPEQAAHG